jgi:hypothetical protein
MLYGKFTLANMIGTNNGINGVAVKCGSNNSEALAIEPLPPQL